MLVLLGAIVALLIINVVGQLYFQFYQQPSAFVVDFIDRFNVDKELSVPTWFASFLAVLAGLVALFNAVMTGGKKSVWWVLGGLFLLISLDETAALHELLLQGLHIAADFGEAQSFSQNAWLFLMPVIAVVALWIVWQAKKQLPAEVFFGLSLGLGIYLLGAVVVEFMSIEVDKVSLAYRFGYTVIEEGLEFLGMWVMLYTALRHAEFTYGHMLKRLFKL